MAIRALKIEPSFTKRDQLSLTLHLQELRLFPVLTPEEETSLAKKISAGDQAALQRLVKCNLKFVVSVAKKYEGQGLLLEDLIAEGNMGLIRAAKRFDHSKGFKFISFAVWYIRQGMQSAIDHQRRIVRLPTNHLDDMMHIHKTTIALEQRLERTPTPEELAQETGLELHKLVSYQAAHPGALSMDTGTEEKPGLYDILPDQSVAAPDQGLEYEDMQAELNRFLLQIPEGEREVIKHYFGFYGEHLSHTEEIAKTRDLCAQTVLTYRRRGLQLLSERPGFQKMREYLHI